MVSRLVAKSTVWSASASPVLVTVKVINPPSSMLESAILKLVSSPSSVIVIVAWKSVSEITAFEPVTFVIVTTTVSSGSNKLSSSVNIVNSADVSPARITTEPTLV